MDDMQRLAEAVFEADGHHDARGKERGKEVALLEAGDVAVHFLAEAGVSWLSGKLIERVVSRSRVYCSMSQQSYRFHHFELLKT